MTSIQEDRILEDPDSFPHSFGYLVFMTNAAIERDDRSAI